MVPPIDSQTVPVMHAAVDAHVRVHRFCPPCDMARQTSGAAQSPSEAQRSSSCPCIVPPVLDVLVVVTVLVDVPVLVTVVVVVPGPVPVLVAAPVPVLVAAPAPEVLVVLPAPPLPVDAGVHWAFASQT
jgi:hypothetical protein